MSSLPRAAASLLLGLFVAASSPALAMNYQLATLGGEGSCNRDCPTVVTATGEIQLNSAEQLVSFVGKSQTDDVRRLLVIDSPGGNVVGSLKLAALLRESKVVVVVGRVASDGRQTGIVNGGCYSACVYAIMGGVRRVVPAGSQVGIHQMSYDGANIADDSAILSVLGQRRADQDFVEVLRGFAKSMGVSPELITMAEKIPPASMRILKPAEIRRLRLAASKL